MTKTSQLDLFGSTIRHIPHDEFLYYMKFTPAIEDKIKAMTGLPSIESVADHLGMYQPVNVGLNAPEGQEAPDFSRYYKDMECPENSFINFLGVLEVPGSMYHFTSYVSPLRNAETLDDVKDFPYPSVDGYTDDHIRAEVDDAHARGLVAASWIGHMYETSWQIRGYEQFLMDMAAAPEICDYILDKLYERNITSTLAVVKSGVDVIMTGDDVANQKAMMFHPDLWRKFIKSRWAKVYEAARSINSDIQIWYHSDGNIEDIIPDLIDIGVTILNPVQSECLDVAKMKREFGKHLVFDGTIGTQTTLPFGTPEQVKDEVIERKRTVGADGALILSPTHILEPEVSIENIMAFVEAVR